MTFRGDRVASRVYRTGYWSRLVVATEVIVDTQVVVVVAVQQVVDADVGIPPLFAPHQPPAHAGVGYRPPANQRS